MLGAGLVALTSRSSAAPLWTIFLGFVAACGPCVAPRVAAAVGCMGSGEAVGIMRVVAFAAGLTMSYGALAAAASALGDLFAISRIAYAVIASSMVVAGLFTLLRCEHDVADRGVARIRLTVPAAFVAGGAFVLVLSPCCAPLVAVILGNGAIDPWEGALSGMLFGVGQSLPLVGIAFCLRVGVRRLGFFARSEAGGIISGGLMLAVGLLYGVLA